jgi:hypothetical protein
VGEGYRFARVGSECNGVGQGPSQLLADRLGDVVVPVTTTAVLKLDCFGAMKVAIQQGTFKVSRSHPEMLRQLAALEFEERDSGTTHIAVPDRAGHDDVAMALCMAFHVSADTAVGMEAPRKRARILDYWPDPEPVSDPPASRPDSVQEKLQRYQEQSAVQVPGLSRCLGGR